MIWIFFSFLVPTLKWFKYSTGGICQAGLQRCSEMMMMIVVKTMAMLSHAGRRKSRLNFLPPPSSSLALHSEFSFQGKWNLMHFSQQQQPQLFDVFSRKERLSHILHIEAKFPRDTLHCWPLKMYQFGSIFWPSLT